MKRHGLISSWITSGILLIFLAMGCSHQSSPVGPEGQLPGKEYEGTPQSPLFSSGIISAQLHLYVGFPNSQILNLHRLEEDWDPGTVTWSSFAAAYSPDVAGTFVAAASGWQEVDVTLLVQGWAIAEYDNFGLLIEQPSASSAPAMLHASEMTSRQPFLEVTSVTSAGEECDTIVPTADVYIDAAAPNSNREGSLTLLVGQLPTAGGDKLILMRFDVPTVSAEPEPAAIGGHAWSDLNCDGIQDTSETGVPGVAVSLYTCQDSLVASTVTDAMGQARFTGLNSGDYLLEFVAPEDYRFSPANQEPGDTLDSDVDEVTGRTECFTVAEGEESLTWAAGLCEAAVVDSGCTRGKGYWKNHAGTRRQADEVTELLPIWLGTEGGDGSLLVDSAALAVDVLSMKVYGHPSNGITKLYAHLLTTKLNIVAGALADDVAEAVTEADAFLGEFSWSDWDSLSRDERKTILAWKDIFEQYNSGEIGPGSCDPAIAAGE